MTNYTFVIGQVGAITKDASENLTRFRKANARLHGLGRNQSGSRAAQKIELLSRIQNVNLKGSLNIYHWFSTKLGDAQPGNQTPKRPMPAAYKGPLEAFLQRRSRVGKKNFPAVKRYVHNIGKAFNPTLPPANKSFE